MTAGPEGGAGPGQAAPLKRDGALRVIIKAASAQRASPAPPAARRPPPARRRGGHKSSPSSMSSSSHPAMASSAAARRLEVVAVVHVVVLPPRHGVVRRCEEAGQARDLRRPRAASASRGGWPGEGCWARWRARTRAVAAESGARAGAAPLEEVQRILWVRGEGRAACPISTG